MATFSVRVSEKEDRLVRSFAEVHGLSLNDLFKEAVFEKIENELDLQSYNKALEAYEKNPISYTHDEVMKELGFK